MPIVELIPDSQSSNSGGWAVTGGADIAAVLADDSNASYVTIQGIGTATLTLSSFTLGPDQRITSGRFRLNYLSASVGSGGTFIAYLVRENFGFPDTWLTYQNRWACAGTDTCEEFVIPGIMDSGWFAKTFTSAQEITQSLLDDLSVDIAVLNPGLNEAITLTTLRVEVDVRNRPTLTVNPALGSPDAAIVSWVPDPKDGDAQTSWEAAIFTEAQTLAGGFDPATSTAVYRATGAGAGTSLVVATELTEGETYYAYVRSAKTLFFDDNDLFASGSRSEEWFSEWASATVLVSPVETTNYVPQLPDEGVLSCHGWAVTVAPRGGGSTLIELPWRSIQWGRRLEEVSEASVIANVSECTALPRFEDLRRWVHEIGIWRDAPDGTPVEEWVGPYVGRNRPDRNSVTFRARDWWALFEKRRLHSDYALAAVDLGTIFAAYALDALSVDESAGIEIQVRSTGILGDRTVVAAQKRRAADLMRELGRDGVDWTMIGRTLLAGGVELPVDALALLIDEHVERISGDETGEQEATDVAVVGRLLDETQILGSAVLADDPRGVLETTINASEIEDTTSADAYAASMLDFLSGDPQTWNLSLSSDAQVGLSKLVPGARWPVKLNSVGLDTTLRLQQVDVTVTRNEETVEETVTVVLTSLGTEA